MKPIYLNLKCEGGFDSVTIADEEWPVTYLWESAIHKLSQGDRTVIQDILAHKIPEKDLEWRGWKENLLVPEFYEAHLIAAACGHPDLARDLYDRGGLKNIKCQSSDFDSYPHHVCPICFEVINLSSSGEALTWNMHMDCLAHIALHYCSDYGVLNLVQAGEVLGYNKFRELFDESGNFEDLKAALFTDDLVGRALLKVADDGHWWEELPSSEALRSFTETCDVDMFGDTDYYAYHPQVKPYSKEVRQLFEQMVERCRRVGLDAFDDYF